MIDGVRTKELKVIPDERGRLMEILRKDDKIFREFGMIYMTTVNPGVVKGWHCHKKQWDNITCIHGMIKLVLYDGRKNSKTSGKIVEFFIGVHNPVLVQIPPHVYHGFKCISVEESLIINIPTNVYNYNKPDEIKLDPHTKEIPYDWSRKDR